MNLNKNFLTEVIKYLISKGVTVHDVLDAFHAEFEYHEQAIKKYPGDVTWVNFKQPSVEESSTPCGKAEKEPERDLKPVKSSWIDYPKNNKNHGNGVSPARKALFDVINGKTVIEHLKENGITYTNFDNRIRKKWSVEQACTTPLASWGKGKRKRVIEEPEEPKEAKAVIVPDNPDTIICLEPEKITGTKTVTHAENTAESVTIEPQTKTNTDARVNDANANSDAIHRDKDNIEKALKKFITSTTGIKYDESKKDKKPKETKSDLTVLEVCQKMNVTTHELRKMINTGDFPQPDCDKKWSVKLLKKEGII